MLKKLKNILFYYKKWWLLVAYCVSVILLGVVIKNHIYEHILRFSFLINAISIIYLCVCVWGCIKIIKFIRCCPILKYKFDKAIYRTNIRNGQGEFPVLSRTYISKYHKHTRIYQIKNNGVSCDIFRAKTPSLEASLNGKIYLIEHGKKNSITLLHFLPRKYIHPCIISANNKSLINYPHTLAVGATGAGKSYALYTLLAIYAKNIKNVSITICDYKKSSFAEFENTPNFYGYDDSIDGIKRFYGEFCERLKVNDVERNKNIRVLLIDEYGALISSQDKKTSDDIKTMVANMLFMGRSLGIKIILGVQRADSEYFKNGARDQFPAILALGNLSKEQKQMLFSDFKDQMTDYNHIGEGYLLINGMDFQRVKIAEIKDFTSLDNSIRKAMYH